MRILVVSSVPPKPTGFGETVLHRHLCTDPRLEVSVVPNPGWPLVIRGLSRTPLCSGSNIWQFLLRGRRWDPGARESLKRARPDVVLTVAHGDGYLAADRLAREAGLPLATMFHDWWPDLAGLPGRFRVAEEQRFLELCRNSAVAFCASEGMCHALGNPPVCQHLHGIPAKANPVFLRQPQKPAEGNRTFRILYLGNLQVYAPMLRGALEALETHPLLRLEVRGKWPSWSPDFAQRMRSLGLWLDYAPRSELDSWLSSADAFLVAVPFEAALRRVMETGFPSKLIECSQFGKPLVVWGPEYCSAVRWARKGDGARIVVDPRPEALVAALESLAADPLEQERLNRESVRAASTEFDPERIQTQFLEALQKAVRPRQEPLRPLLARACLTS